MTTRLFFQKSKNFLVGLSTLALMPSIFIGQIQAQNSAPGTLAPSSRSGNAAKTAYSSVPPSTTKVLPASAPIAGLTTINFDELGFVGYSSISADYYKNKGVRFYGNDSASVSISSHEEFCADTKPNFIFGSNLTFSRVTAEFVNPVGFVSLWIHDADTVPIDNFTITILDGSGRQLDQIVSNVDSKRYSFTKPGIKKLVFDSSTDREGIDTITFSSTNVDGTAPSLSISEPRSGVLIESIKAINGRVEDQIGGSGIDRIQLSLFRYAEGEVAQYWNGSSWVNDEQFLKVIRINNSWSLGSNLPTVEDTPEGDYIVAARAIDKNGNASLTQYVLLNKRVRRVVLVRGTSNTSKYGEETDSEFTASMVGRLKHAGYKEDDILIVNISDQGVSRVEYSSQNVWNAILDRKRSKWSSLGGKVEIDLIAHSAGGLVSRHMLNHQAANSDELSVRNLITLGTPLGGIYTLGKLAHKPGSAGIFEAMNPKNCLNNPNYAERKETKYWKIGGGSGARFSWNPGSLFGAIPYAIANEPDREDGLVNVKSVRGLSPASEENPPCEYRTRYRINLNHGELVQDEGVFNDLILPVLQGQGWNACEAEPVKKLTVEDLDTNQFVESRLLQLAQGAVQNIVLPVDASSEAVFNITASSQIDFSLKRPDGTLINPTVSDPNITYEEISDESGLHSYLYKFPNPAPGLWTVSILPLSVPSDDRAASLVAQVRNQLSLGIIEGETEYPTGASPYLSAKLAAGGAAQTGTITATATSASGKNYSISLKDDGLAGDAEAGDGIYGGRFPSLTEGGTYDVRVRAVGSNALGQKFQRVDLGFFIIAPDGANFSGTPYDYGYNSDGDDTFEQLAVSLGLDITASGRYFVVGDLLDEAGEVIATARSLSADYPVGIHNLELLFDGPTILASRKAGPYHLKLRLFQDNEARPLLVTTGPDYSTTAYAVADFDHPPIVSVLPDTPVQATTFFQIPYFVTDEDTTATVNLYYDSDSADFNGKLIASNLPVGAQLHTWNTTGIKDGNYYIYAIASDGIRPAVAAYSPSTVTISNAPRVAFTQPLYSGVVFTSLSQATGTAAASPVRTLSTVTVRLYRAATDTNAAGYWAGGNSWSTTATAANDIDVSGLETWNMNLPSLDNGQYTLQATVTDNTGQSTKSEVLTFYIEDTVPAISVLPATVTEGNSSTVLAKFTLSLSRKSFRTVSVGYSLGKGALFPATADVDYETLPPGTLQFAPGETSKTISVPVYADLLDEENETFLLKLTTPQEATLTNDSAVGTIVDNDSPPAIRSSPLSITEGDSGTQMLRFEVTLSQPSSKTVTVAYATLADTATASSDFTSTSGTLSFSPGQTFKNVNVPVVGDLISENDEQFYLQLSAPVNATIGTAKILGTIFDNDSYPDISVKAGQIKEGNTGTVELPFTVRLSKTSGRVVTVSCQTGRASIDAAIPGTDFVALPSTKITFAPNEITKTVNVQVRGDLLNEPNERVPFLLTQPVNANLLIASGEGVIQDDDAVPTLSVSGSSVQEANSGSVDGTFTIKLSGASGKEVAVCAQTSSGLTNSASSVRDYSPLAQTVFTFAPGETTKTISVPVYGDTLDELDETFRLVLSLPSNATLATSSAVCTIVDNDATPSLRVSDASVTEGDSGSLLATFSVTLSAPSGLSVAVNYSTLGVSAQTGSDFVAVSGTLPFINGETTKTITVPILGDKIHEGNETFQVLLASAVNASISDGTGVGTIVDNEALPVISVNRPTVAEGNDGEVGFLTFKLTLSGPSSKPVSVTFATGVAAAVPVANRATADDDYSPVPATLITFAPGEVSKEVLVDVLGDGIDENNESVGVKLTSPVNAILASAAGEGVITDNDAAPTLSITDLVLAEGNTGTTSAILRVRLSAASGRDVFINFNTVDGTALAGSDYEATSGTLKFSPGDLEKAIVIPIITDRIKEANETFNVALTGGVNVGITKGTGKVTINNDDSAGGS